MCIDPVATMMMIGTGIKMFGAIKASADEGRGYDDQARRNERLIDLERRRQALEVARKHDNAEREIGRQITSFGDNGIQIDGSALDYIEDAATQADREINAIRTDSGTRRDDLAYEASQFRRAGKNARKRGKTGAFAKLLSGGTKLAGSFGAPAGGGLQGKSGNLWFGNRSTTF